MNTAFDFIKEGITEEQAKNRVAYIKKLMEFGNPEHFLCKDIIKCYLIEQAKYSCGHRKFGMATGGEYTTDLDINFPYMRESLDAISKGNFKQFVSLTHECENSIHLSHQYSPPTRFNSFSALSYDFENTASEDEAVDKRKLVNFIIVLGDVTMFRICEPVSSNRNVTPLEYCFNFPNRWPHEIAKFGITHKEALCYLQATIVNYQPTAEGERYTREALEYYRPKVLPGSTYSLLKGHDCRAITNYIFDNRVELMAYVDLFLESHVSNGAEGSKESKYQPFVDSVTELRNMVINCLDN